MWNIYQNCCVIKNIVVCHRLSCNCLISRRSPHPPLHHLMMPIHQFIRIQSPPPKVSNIVGDIVHGQNNGQVFVLGYWKGLLMKWSIPAAKVSCSVCESLLADMPTMRKRSRRGRPVCVQ